MFLTHSIALCGNFANEALAAGRQAGSQPTRRSPRCPHEGGEEGNKRRRDGTYGLYPQFDCRWCHMTGRFHGSVACCSILDALSLRQRTTTDGRHTENTSIVFCFTCFGVSAGITNLGDQKMEDTKAIGFYTGTVQNFSDMHYAISTDEYDHEYIYNNLMRFYNMQNVFRLQLFWYVEAVGITLRLHTEERSQRRLVTRGLITTSVEYGCKKSLTGELKWQKSTGILEPDCKHRIKGPWPT